MWTQERSYDRQDHPRRAGYNPKQSYRPAPMGWMKDKFGFCSIRDNGYKLTPGGVDPENKTPQKWKLRPELASCADVLNYWVGRQRSTTIDPEDPVVMSNPTLICYFTLSSVGLQAGGADHGALTSLSEAFVRTDVSQYTKRVAEKQIIVIGQVGCATE